MTDQNLKMSRKQLVIHALASKKFRVYIRKGIITFVIALVLGILCYIWIFRNHKSNSFFDVTWRTTGKIKVIEFNVKKSDNTPLAHQNVWCTNDTDSIGGRTNEEGYLQVVIDGEGPIWKLDLKDHGFVEWYLFHPSADNGLAFTIHLK